MNRLEKTSRSSRPALLLMGFWTFLFSSALKPALSQAADCETSIARLVSLEGKVTLKKTNEDTWQEIEVAKTFCPSDAIQVGENSRAVILLSDHSLVRLDAQTLLTFSNAQKEGSFWVELLKGIGHFISRVPRRLNISTPYVNAMVEGTEFLISVDRNKTFLSVFEGKVLARNDQGDLKLSTGQSAVAKASQPPIIRQVVRPRDAVQWALHYPVILQFTRDEFVGHLSSAWQSQVTQSIASFERGALSEAFDALSGVTSNVIKDPRFFTYRATLRLSVGQVSGARDDLAQALVLKSDDGDALALLAIIAVVQNNKEEALRLSNKALALTPNAVGPLLARSYAFQANFQLDDAREVAEASTLQSPGNAIAWSRLAELRLMSQELSKALEAAQKAVKINPGIARTQSILGFSYLMQVNIESAKEAFERAIAFDQGAPLPRLGLGLAKIREGKLREGRRGIEIAAMLDPNHSLIRSYLGKAYYEEKRNELAIEQYEIARELDPKDPTPDLYSAILNQTSNKPVSALRDIKRSIAMNDNRAIYRSRLLLDRDLAARSVGQGRIYNDLGFDQLALLESSRSLSINPRNYTAHRLLSDSYALRSRHEIGRVSELLQSQLLQPINVNPVKPELAETNLNLVTSFGPADAAFNEFTPLFQRNQVRSTVSGIFGNNGTLGEEVVVSGIQDRFSYSLGQFHYETDGFRKNNQVEHDIYNLFTQIALTPKLDFQVEYRWRETAQGDLRLVLDPSFEHNEKRALEQEMARAGFHVSLSSKSDLIFSLIHNDRETMLESSNLIAISNVEARQKGWDLQGQYLLQNNDFNLVFGAGTYKVDEDLEINIDLSDFLNLIGEEDSSISDSGTAEQNNVYLYLNTAFPDNLVWTFGIGYGAVEEEILILDTDHFSPKFGLEWSLSEHLKLRGAFFRTLKRPLISNQTLEPTQISGFTQFFDDLNGTNSDFYGVALDAVLKPTLRGGLEGHQRKLKQPETSASDGVLFVEQKERFYRLYLYWTLLERWALSVEGLYEGFEGGLATPVKPSKLDEFSIPLRLGYFSASGLFLELGGTYTYQKVEFRAESDFIKDREKFAVANAVIGYRLPKRSGILSIEITNLFNRKFLYQGKIFINADKFQSNTGFTPNRVILFRLTLNF